MRKRVTLSLFCVLLVSLGFQDMGIFAQGTEDTEAEKTALERLGPALAAQKSHEDQLFALPGVIAVGIGLTEPGQVPTLDVFLDMNALGASPRISLLRSLWESRPAMTMAAIQARWGFGFGVPGTLARLATSPIIT
jgi:hypothetical protein